MVRALALVLLLGLAVVAQRPVNFVVVVTDDQRSDAVGHEGHPYLRTPNVDALAANGERFSNSFVTTAICAASRASILTGQWEGTHGYTFGTPPLSDAQLRNAWPRLLRDAGYRTGFVGKWGVRNSKASRQAMWEQFSPMSAPYLRKRGEAVQHQTDHAAERAVKFLRETPADRPFCLYLCFNAPHAEDPNPDQYIPPADLAELYADAEVGSPELSDAAFFAALPEFQRDSLNRVRWHWRFDTPAKHRRMVRNYHAMITGVDRALGNVLAALRNLDRADDTVVIYTSDNGCFLGERGFAGKWTIHERSIRVPLIVHDPRRKRTGDGQLSPMALNVDLAPTIVELAGLPVPDSYQGRSLLPWLRGEAPEWRDDFFYEHRMKHAKIPKSEGVRGERWVYARYYEQQPVFEELYDLVNDPLQARNLALEDEFSERLAAMRKRCAALRETRVRPR